MTTKWPTKDPDETLDYGFDWAPRRIGDDTITGLDHALSNAGGLTVDEFVLGTQVEVDDYNAFVDEYNARLAEGEERRTHTVLGQFTVIWLKGGTPGGAPVVQMTVTTQGGRILDQQVTLPIKERT